jgi:predicted 3-demethylubiquinone-9 3-methyltransferase (glyoxalase superfamily)
MGYMKKITPHLWFDEEAKQAAELYTSLFPCSKVTHTQTIQGTPGGDTDIVSFEIGGQPFMAISAGPVFKINPSISFILNFDPSKDKKARANLDAAWEKLSEGGNVLMEINTYPFSERYGWIQDKYGVSWQLMLTNPNGEERPFVTPSLMFTQKNAGRAEEAIDLYCSIFKDGKRGTTSRYPANMPPHKEGTIMFADFNILSTWLAAMDSAGEHNFSFNEAVSLLIPCDTQEEIDYYWEKLSADPKAEQCGWLKDKFGVSWQVWPTEMGNMMSEGTPEQIARVTQAFMPMKKFDIAALKRAYEG